MTRWERLAAFEGGTVSWLATATSADGSPHVFVATVVGVFRSTDRGLSWEPLGGASRVAGAEVVAASPRYAEDGIVYAGALGGLFRFRAGGADWEHLLSGSRVLSVAVAVAVGDPVAPPDGSGLTVLAGTETDGILVSRDGGRTWDGANAGLLDLEILALAVTPRFREDGLAFAASPTALYRSRNGAESWREVELDRDDVTVQCLAISPGFPEDRVILAGTEDHGLLRSDDGGRSWQSVPALASRMVNSLSLSAQGHVVASTDVGLARSDDGGASWRLVGEDLGGVGGAVLLPNGDAGVLLAGLPDTGAPRVPGLPHTGVARSEDSGVTWMAANAGLAASAYAGLLLSPHFERDQTLYAYDLHPSFAVSEDGGRTWETRDDVEERVTVLELSGGGLVLDVDRQSMWEEVLASFTPRGSVAAAALAPGAAHQGVGDAYVVATDPARDGVRHLTLWRTADRGRRWDRWLDLADVPAGAVSSIVALPANRWDDTVVLAYGARVLRPRPNTWEVREGERRPVWDAAELPDQDETGRLPAVTSLAASPEYARDRTLFAATSAGPYVSRDGGASFLFWGDGLEPLTLVDVTLSPAYARDRLVYALGLGGTIWRRHDDVSR